MLAWNDVFRTLQRLIMVVTAGRSGSVFFANLINENAINASSEHEPDLVPFDTAALWYYEGNERELAGLAARKLSRLRTGDRLSSVPGGAGIHQALTRSPLYGKLFKTVIPQVPIREVYVEVNNAFLKSFGPALLKLVPSLEIVHLTRHPLEVAKSAYNRGSYPNPKRPYYLWPSWDRNELQLDDRITQRLSSFQLALWYWFEMELRYVAMCEQYQVAKTTDVDLRSLNDPDEVIKLFDAHRITYRTLSTTVDRHKGNRDNIVDAEERMAAKEFLRYVPEVKIKRIRNTYGLENL